MNIHDFIPSSLNLDAIMSDPILLVASILLLVGPVVFLVSLWKFLRAPSKSSAFSIPPLEEDAEPEINIPSHVIEQEEPEPAGTKTSGKVASPENFSMPKQESKTGNGAMEKTMVMPSGMGEVQGQLEIAFSQLKTINKKVLQLESEIESLSQKSADRLDRNELQELPMNAADFTKKLLKLAEHVIVLEKEMARMKTKDAPPAQAEEAEEQSPEKQAAGVIPGSPKPPIMPL